MQRRRHALHVPTTTLRAFTDASAAPEKRVERRAGAVNLIFGEDTFAVGAGGFDGNIHSIGNFLEQEALAQQGEEFRRLRRKAVGGGVAGGRVLSEEITDLSGGLDAEHSLPGEYSAEAVEEFIGVEGLEQNRVGPGEKCSDGDVWRRGCRS